MEGPAIKRRRGLQQRLDQQRAERALESQVNAVLMSYLAAGVLSGVRCHAIAQAASADIRKARDGFEFPDLDTLASVKEDRMLSAKVDQLLASESQLPMPMAVDMPYKAGKSPTWITLPHEIFAAMYCEEKTCGIGS